MKQAQVSWLVYVRPEGRKRYECDSGCDSETAADELAAYYRDLGYDAKVVKQKPVKETR